MDEHDELPPTGDLRWPLTWFAIITGAVDEILRQCSKHDQIIMTMLGVIMVFQWIYTTGLFTLIGYSVFVTTQQYFRPDIVLVAMFLSSMLLALDSWFWYYPSWHQQGIQEIRRGGLAIASAAHGGTKTLAAFAARFGFSVGFSQLSALFVVLLVFAPDIRERIEVKYQKENAALIEQASRPKDAEIKRETDMVAAETEQVNELSRQIAALRQNQVDPGSASSITKRADDEVTRLTAQKAEADDDAAEADAAASRESGGIKGTVTSGIAGRGPRYRSFVEQAAQARSRSQKIAIDLAAAQSRLDGFHQPEAMAKEIQRAHDQLPEFEKALAAETEKLASMKEHLAKLISGREEAIRQAVEKAPNYVPRDNGFLARTKILAEIADESPKIASVILLVEIVSLGLEISGVLAKICSYVPTSYAIQLARKSYLEAVRAADEISCELKAIDGWDPKWPEITGGSQSSPTLVATPQPPGDATPPKRGRGRPRKYPLPDQPISNANGQGKPKPPSDPLVPA